MILKVRGNSWALKTACFQVRWCNFAEFQGLVKQSRVLASDIEKLNIYPQTILTHVAFKSNCWKSWKRQLNEFSFRTWKKWAVETSSASQSCHPSHQSEWHQLCCQASQKAFYLESSLGKEAFQDRIHHSEIFCSRKVGGNSITCDLIKDGKLWLTLWLCIACNWQFQIFSNCNFYAQLNDHSSYLVTPFCNLFLFGLN